MTSKQKGSTVLLSIDVKHDQMLAHFENLEITVIPKLEMKKTRSKMKSISYNRIILIALWKLRIKSPKSMQK